MATTAPFIAVSAGDVSLTIGNFVTLEGSVSFTNNNGQQTFSGTGVTLFLGRGPPQLPDPFHSINPTARGVLLTNGTIGLVEIAGTNGSPNTFALQATGQVQLLGVPGVTLAGTVSIQFNNTGMAFTGTGNPVTFATAANVASFSGTGLRLSVLGQTLTGDFSFSQATDATGNQVLTLALANGSLVLGGGTVSLLNASGVFVASSAGFAGTVTGTLSVSGGSAVQFGAGFSVSINTAATAVNEQVTLNNTTLSVNLPAGPYLMVQGTNAQLIVLQNLQLTGNFALEQTGSQVSIAATNIHLGLGDGTHTLLSVDNGSGFFVLGSGGLAGTFSGAVTVNVPGVAFSGSFQVSINTTGAAVDQTIAIGSSNVALNLPAGQYVMVAGTGITLSVLGQTLTGDFTAQQTTTTAGTQLVQVSFANVGLSLGDGTTNFVTLTNGTGTFFLTAAGIAGQASVNVAVNPSTGVSFAGAFALQINTTSTAVNDSVTVNGVVVPINVPAGPYLQIAGTGLTLTVAGQSLTGNFVLQSQTTAAGNRVVTVAVSNATLALGDGTTALVTVSNGSGALILNSGALAGSFSGSLAVNIPGVTLTATTVSVLVNNGSQAVNQTITVAGQPVTVNVAAGPYVQVMVLGARLTVAGQLLTGDFVFDRGKAADGTMVTRAAVTNLALTVNGQGLQNGQGAIIVTTTGIAGVASGQVSVAAGGAQIGGDVTVRFNTTGGAVNQTVTVNGTPLPVVFSAAEGNLFQFVLANGVLQIGNFILIEGSLSFTGTGTTQTVTSTSVTVFIGQGPAYLADGTTINPTARGLLLTNATVNVERVTDAMASGGFDYAVYASGNVNLLGIPGVTLSAPGQPTMPATVTVQFNNTGADWMVPNTSVTVANGARSFSGSMSLTVLGQTLSGNISFDQTTTTAGAKVLTVAFSGVSLVLGGGLVSVTNVSGAVLLNAQGLAGQVSGSLAVQLGTSVSGSANITLALNTTGVAVQQTATVPNGMGGTTTINVNLPAGPFVRVEADPLSLTVLGQTLTGNFTFEQTTDASQQTIIRVGATNVTLSLGSPAIVSVTNGQGAFILTSSSLAGTLSGTVALNAGEASLVGTFQVQVNTGSTAVNDSFMVDGTPVAVAVPAGPFVQVAGTGVQLSVMNQTLSGNFTFQQTTANPATGPPTTVATLHASNVNLSLGDGSSQLLNVSIAAIDLVFSSGGIAGMVTGATVTSTLPGLSLAGNFTASFNTTSGPVNESFTAVDGTTATINFTQGNFIQVTGTGVSLTALGQTLSGNFTIQQTNDVPDPALGTTSTGQVVAVAVTNLSLTLGPAGGPAIVSVTSGTGGLRITSAGIAADFSLMATLTLPGFTGSASIHLQVNTGPQTVAAEINAPGISGVVINLPAGPFVRVEATGVSLTFGGSGPDSGFTVSGNVAIDQSTDASGTTVTRIAFTNVQVMNGTSTWVTQGQGAFVIENGGLAGSLSGTAGIGASGFSVSATIGLTINNTGLPVHETVTVAGQQQVIDFPTNADVFSFFGQGNLNLGGFVTIEGSFAFSNNQVGVSNASIFLGQGPATRSDGSINPSARGVLLSGASFGLVKIPGTGGNPDTYALVATGAIQVLGIPGVSFSGTATIDFNNTGQIFSARTIAIPGAPAVVLNFPTTAVVKTFSGTGLTLSVLGQTLTGDFSFSQTTDASGASVFSVTAANVTLSLGGGLVRLTGGSGALLLTSAGLAGQVDGTVTVATGTGVSFGGTFHVQFNNTTAAVNVNVAHPVQLTGTPSLTFAAATTGGDTITRSAGSFITDGFQVGSSVQITGTTKNNGTYTIAAVTDTVLTLTTLGQLQAETATSAQALVVLPAGPYVRVSGTGVTLTVAGQTLTGNFAFQQQSTTGGTPVVTVTFTNVGLSLGGGLVSVTNANGVFLLTSAGLAGSVAATVAIAPSTGVSLSGNVLFEINTTTSAVNQTIAAAVGTVTLNVPAGPLVRVEVDNANLMVAGQMLTGNFFVQQQTTPAGGSVLTVAFSNVSLALTAGGTPLVTVSGASGAFLLSSAGLAGTAAGTVTIAPSTGISATGTVNIAINSTGAAVSQTFTVNGATVAVNLPAGPFVEVQILTATLTVPGFTLTADEIDFQQSGTGSNASITLSGRNLSFVLQAGSTRIIGLQHANFSFTLAANGIAGVVTNATLLGPDLGGAVTLAGTVSLQLNTTPTQQMLMVGGQSVTLPAAAGGVSFVKVVLTANPDGTPVTLGVLGNMLTATELDFVKNAAGVQVSGTNLGFLLQVGGHRIIQISNAAFAFTFTQAGITGAVLNAVVLGPDYTDASGNPLINFQGTVSLLINTTPTAQTLMVGTQSVTVAAAAVGSAYLRVEIDGSNGQPATLAVSNVATLTADQFILQKQGTEVDISGTNLGFTLAAGSTRIVAISGADFAFRFTQDGLSGVVLNGAVQGPAITGVTLSGTFSLLLNTTPDVQTFTLDGQTLTVAAAATGSPYARVEVTGTPATTTQPAMPATLSVFGQTLTVDDFVLQASGSGSTSTVTVTGQNLGFLLSAGGTRIIQISNASFAFLFTQAGVTGAVVNATVLGPDLGGTVTLSGTVALLVNTTTTAMTLSVGGQSVAVPAAPASGYFVQVTVTNGVLTVLGNSLTADSFVFQNSGGNVTVTGTNLGLVLQSGGRRILALQNGNFDFLFPATGGGIAGAAMGTLLGPDFGNDFTLSGTITVLVNTTTLTTAQSFMIGTQTVMVPAVTAGGSFVQVTVTNGALTVLGSALTAQSLTFQSTVSAGVQVVQLTATGVSLSLGDANNPVVLVTVATAMFTINNQGIAGSFMGAVTVNVPGFLLTTNLQVQIDTTAPANQYVIVTGTGIHLTIGGQTLIADVVFQQVTGSDGQRVVRVAVNNLSLVLGDTGSPIALSGTAPSLTFAPATTGGDTITRSSGSWITDGITAGNVILITGSAQNDGAYTVATVSADGLTLTLTTLGKLKSESGTANVHVQIVQPYVTITGGQGFLVVNSNGVAASVTVTATFSLPGLSLSATTIQFEINTTSVAVVESIVLAGDTINLQLPAGPFTRITVLGGQLNVGSGVVISGDFSITHTATYTSVAIANLAVTYQGNGITNGSGGFILFSGSGGGIAGSLSGDISVAASGFSVGGSLGLRINTTTMAVNQTLMVGGQMLPITFAATEVATASGPFISVFGGGVHLKIANFVEVESSNFAVTGNTAGATGITLFVGQGPVYLSDGTTINPAAQGLLLTNASLGVVKVAGTSGTTYAVTATGMLQIIGISGVSLSGMATVMVNNTGAAVNQTIVLPAVGTTPASSIQVMFPTANMVTSVVASGVSLTVAGQTLMGNFTFNQVTDSNNNTVLTIHFDSVSLNLGGGLAMLSAGTGDFVMTSAGIAGMMSANVQVTASPNVIFGGGFSLAINNTLAPVNDTIPVTLNGTTTHTVINLPAGPYLRVQGTGVSLTLKLSPTNTVALTGDFALEQSTVNLMPSGTATQVRVAVNNLSFSLGDGSNNIVSVTGGFGFLVITPGGLAGTLSATIASGISSLSLGGTFTVSVNTTNAPVVESFMVGANTVMLNLPTGPFLRVAGNNVTLTVAGQTLSGNFVFEQQTTTNPASTLVVVDFTNVSLAFGDGTNTLVAVTIPSAVFVLTGAGLAGQVTNAGVTITASANARFTGTFNLVFNTSSTAVNASVNDANLNPVTVSVPAGPFIEVTGTGLMLTVAGQTLSGNFTFQSQTAADGSRVVTVAVSQLTVSLQDGSGNNLVSLTNGSGALILTNQGLAGSVQATVNAGQSAANFQLSGTLALQINNMPTAVSEVVMVGSSMVTVNVPAGPFVRVSATNAQLTVAGQSISGNFVFQKDTTTSTNPAVPAQTVIRFAASNVSVALGQTDGAANLIHGLMLTQGSGLFLLQSSGIAGTASGVVQAVGIPGVVLQASLTLNFNNTGAPIDETLEGVTLNFTQGNFVSVSGSLTLNIADPSSGQSFVALSGMFGFQVTFDTQGHPTMLTITASGVSAFIGASGVGLSLTNASLNASVYLVSVHPAGSFTLTAEGTVALTGLSDLGLSGTIDVNADTTNGTSYTISTRTGTVLTLTTPVATLSGSFGIAKNATTNEISISATNVSFAAGQMSGGTLTLGVQVTGGTLLAVIEPDGTYDFDASGAASVVGISGVTFMGNLHAQRNTTTSAAHTVTIGATSTPLTVPAGTSRFGADNVSLMVAGVTLTGSFAIQQSTNPGPDGVLGTADDFTEVLIAATGVSIFVGANNVGVQVSGASLAMLIAPGGIAVQAGGSVQLVGIQHLGLSGTLSFQRSTFTTDINRSITVNGVTQTLSVPANSNRFGGTGLMLTAAGQSLSGDFSFSEDNVNHVLMVTASNVVLSLGDGTNTLVQATGSGMLTVQSNGIQGSITATLAVNLPSVQVLAGAFTIDVNTITAPNYVRVSGTGVSLSIAGQTIGLTPTGTFTVVQTTATDGSKVVTFSVNGLMLVLAAGGTTFVNVTNGGGTFLLTAQGIAANFAVTASFAVPGVTLTATSVVIDVNTMPVAVNETITGASQPLVEPMGPFFRVTAIGASLTVGSAATLMGSFSFDQTTVAGQGTVTRFAATGITLAVSGSNVLGNGQGGFIISTAGVAGFLSGMVMTPPASVPGFSAGGDIGFRINSTPNAVDETIAIGGHSVNILFGPNEVASGGSAFTQFYGANLTLNIDNFITIGGSLSFTNTTLNGVAVQEFAGTGLSIFLGQGPATLDNGDINPGATGLYLANANIGVIKFTSGGTATYALDATGTVQLLGVTGVTVSGTAHVRVNDSGQTVNQTLSIPGTTQNVLLSFSTTDQVDTFTATALTISVLGQSLTGDFSFTKTTTAQGQFQSLVVQGSNVGLTLGSGSTPIVSVTQGSGALQVTSAGLAGDFSASVAVNIPQVTFSGQFDLALNTTSAAVSFMPAGSSTAINVPAGPFVHVSGQNVSLGILGQTLTGNFAFEKLTQPDGSSLISVAATNVGLTFASGGTNLVVVSQGQGSFVASAAGLAGQLERDGVDPRGELQRPVQPADQHDNGCGQPDLHGRGRGGDADAAGRAVPASGRHQHSAGSRRPGRDGQLHLREDDRRQRQPGGPRRRQQRELRARRHQRRRPGDRQSGADVRPPDWRRHRHPQRRQLEQRRLPGRQYHPGHRHQRGQRHLHCRGGHGHRADTDQQRPAERRDGQHRRRGAGDSPLRLTDERPGQPGVDRRGRRRPAVRHADGQHPGRAGDGQPDAANQPDEPGGQRDDPGGHGFGGAERAGRAVRALRRHGPDGDGARPVADGRLRLRSDDGRDHAPDGSPHQRRQPERVARRRSGDAQQRLGVLRADPRGHRRPGQRHRERQCPGRQPERHAQRAGQHHRQRGQRQLHRPRHHDAGDAVGADGAVCGNPGHRRDADRRRPADQRRLHLPEGHQLDGRRGGQGDGGQPARPANRRRHAPREHYRWQRRVDRLPAGHRWLLQHQRDAEPAGLRLDYRQHQHPGQHHLTSGFRAVRQRPDADAAGRAVPAGDGDEPERDHLGRRHDLHADGRPVPPTADGPERHPGPQHWPGARHGQRRLGVADERTGRPGRDHDESARRQHDGHRGRAVRHRDG